jgi:hypothetical protein
MHSLIVRLYKFGGFSYSRLLLLTYNCGNFSHVPNNSESSNPEKHLVVCIFSLSLLEMPCLFAFSIKQYEYDRLSATLDPLVWC